MLAVTGSIGNITTLRIP